MNKFLLIIVFCFSIQFSNANDRDLVLTQARELKESKNYNEAIKQYVSYIKLFKDEAVNLKDIYFEVANCYFKNNNNSMAFKVIKETITKYGVTKEDIEASKILDSKLIEISWASIYNDYTTLRKQFVKRLNNVDLYVENNIVELKKN